MKKWRLLLIFSLLAVAGFSALVIILNTHHVMPSPAGAPARIVSLTPNITEILFALGLEEKIVGVSSDSDYPPAAANKQKVGTFWMPDTEAIIICKPDLVIAQDFEQQKKTADTLSRIGYHVVVLEGEKIDDLWPAIKKIGQAAGCDEKAEKLINNMKNRLNEMQKKTESIVKKKVLWVIQDEPVRVAGRNTFINEMIELAGGVNAIGPTLQQYPQIGSEELTTCDAEVIIHSAMVPETIDKQQHNAESFWSKFPNLPAVKNKRIYVINSDATLRLGPRLPDAVEEIGGYLYPDIFTSTKYKQEPKQ
jgi:iron complex transport system substrate-binding protein